MLGTMLRRQGLPRQRIRRACHTPCSVADSVTGLLLHIDRRIPRWVPDVLTRAP